jgi:hypothetical protein
MRARSKWRKGSSQTVAEPPAPWMKTIGGSLDVLDPSTRIRIEGPSVPAGLKRISARPP